MLNLERATSSLLTLAAIAMAGTLVHREFFTSAPHTTPTKAEATTYRKDWQNALTAGTRIGSESAKVKLVEFSDYECPFCRRFQAAYDSVKAQLGDSIALIYVHFPLSMHRFARPAARAAECAGRFNRFGEMTSMLFAKQDSLGLKSWNAYAAEAGVHDTVGFARCLTEPVPPQDIDAGVRMGQRFGVQSTPTILMNGWAYNIPPNTEILARDARAILAGKRPASSTSASQ